MIINLIHNNGYRWFEKSGIYVKGYLIDKYENFYTDEEIVDFFIEVKSENDFFRKLKEATGLFSVIIQNEEGIFAAVDRVRMFPLFYADNQECISDDAYFFSKNQVEEKSVLEFEMTGFVTGKNTLLKDVYQIQAGEAVIFSDGTRKSVFYYEHLTEKTFDDDFQEQSNELADILTNVFKKTLKNITTETIVIPLSGGFDSRFIVSMVKKLGYKNIFCYTYGRKDIPELENARKTAELLNVKWIFIEYTKEMVKGFSKTDVFNEYYKFSSNYVSMFFLQEYFAVKYLKENNIIPDNSIFLPGHTGDVLAGSHLNSGLSPNISKKVAANEIFKAHYNFFIAKRGYRNDKIASILQSILHKSGLPHTLYENWDMKERQAKYIVNSSNVYNFFGYKHRLPFWDFELVDFFRKVSFENKLHNRLYHSVLQNDFFEKDNLIFSKELKPTMAEISFQRLKEYMKSFIPIPKRMMKKKLQKKDYHLYGLASEELKKDMKGLGTGYENRLRKISGFLTKWLVFMIGK